MFGVGRSFVQKNKIKKIKIESILNVNLEYMFYQNIIFSRNKFSEKLRKCYRKRLGA